MLTRFRPTVFPTEVDCGGRFALRLAMGRWVQRAPSRAWSPARNSRDDDGTVTPFQTGVARTSCAESRQQDFFDPRLGRPKAYIWIERSCLEICRGDPIRTISMPALEALKRIPLPVVLMDTPTGWNGTRLRRVGRVHLLSTETFRRRLEFCSLAQRGACPQADAPRDTLALGLAPNVQLLGHDGRGLALVFHLLDRHGSRSHLNCLCSFYLYNARILHFSHIWPTNFKTRCRLP